MLLGQQALCKAKARSSFCHCAAAQTYKLLQVQGTKNTDRPTKRLAEKPKRSSFLCICCGLFKLEIKILVCIYSLISSKSQIHGQQYPSKPPMSISLNGLIIYYLVILVILASPIMQYFLECINNGIQFVILQRNNLAKIQ